MNFSRLLDGSVGFSDSDLSLLSWLQSIPPETFAVPFAQRTLNVDVERLERPSLETSWTEHMLITPIKPKTFPHSAMPFTRPRSAADMMSRSLVPALEAGLGPRSPGPKNTTIPSAALMALSTGDINPMSRSSFASFHLTGFKNNKLMNTSVDRLFENEGDVFLSSSYAEFQQLPSIQETTANNQPKAPPRTRGHSKSPESKRKSFLLFPLKKTETTQQFFFASLQLSKPIRLRPPRRSVESPAENRRPRRPPEAREGIPWRRSQPVSRQRSRSQPRSLSEPRWVEIIWSRVTTVTCSKSIKSRSKGCRKRFSRRKGSGTIC